jgi:hypothetical protein
MSGGAGPTAEDFDAGAPDPAVASAGAALAAATSGNDDAAAELAPNGGVPDRMSGGGRSDADGAAASLLDARVRRITGDAAADALPALPAEPRPPPPRITGTVRTGDGSPPGATFTDRNPAGMPGASELSLLSTVSARGLSVLEPSPSALRRMM